LELDELLSILYIHPQQCTMNNVSFDYWFANVKRKCFIANVSLARATGSKTVKTNNVTCGRLFLPLDAVQS
jgi:hypothetical protein